VAQRNPRTGGCGGELYRGPRTRGILTLVGPLSDAWLCRNRKRLGRGRFWLVTRLLEGDWFDWRYGGGTAGKCRKQAWTRRTGVDAEDGDLRR